MFIFMQDAKGQETKVEIEIGGEKVDRNCLLQWSEQLLQLTTSIHLYTYTCPAKSVCVCVFSSRLRD